MISCVFAGNDVSRRIKAARVPVSASPYEGDKQLVRSEIEKMRFGDGDKTLRRSFPCGVFSRQYILSFKTKS